MYHPSMICIHDIHNTNYTYMTLHLHALSNMTIRCSLLIGQVRNQRAQWAQKMRQCSYWQSEPLAAVAHVVLVAQDVRDAVRHEHHERVRPVQAEAAHVRAGRDQVLASGHCLGSHFLEAA